MGSHNYASSPFCPSSKLIPVFLNFMLKTTPRVQHFSAFIIMVGCVVIILLHYSSTQGILQTWCGHMPSIGVHTRNEGGL